MIPFEYVRTMRVLHNKAPQSNFKDVLNVIKEDLGCEVKYHFLNLFCLTHIFITYFLQPSSVFKHIEEVPLGTASLAQVHKATLMDGTTVAIKVQHPLVKAFSQVDMKCMEV